MDDLVHLNLTKMTLVSDFFFLFASNYGIRMKLVYNA